MDTKYNDKLRKVMSDTARELRALAADIDYSLNRLKPEVFNYQVEDLNLSMRTQNCLRNQEIKTIEDLLSKTRRELLRQPNFGNKSLREIEEVLANFGLRLEG